jgi:hypothetical protein
MERTRPSTTMRLVRHAALGRCMYCLAAGVPLTEEHLIPRALGGRLTLRDAVCEPCRRLTGRLEQRTLDREFAVPKTLLALKRRRARGKGPSRLPPVILQGHDAATATLTATDFPRTFSLPVFGPAGLLARADRAASPPRLEVVACTLALGTPRRRNVAAALPLADPAAYGYAIAKWAYALAVAERGLEQDGVHPLRDLLLGRRDDVFAFVGNPASGEPAGRDALHASSMQEVDGWLTLRLALFASAGMTPYEIVIARARSDSRPA